MITTSLEDTLSPCGDRGIKNREPAKRCTKGPLSKTPPVPSCEVVAVLGTDGTGKGWGEEAVGDFFPTGSASGGEERGKELEQEWPWVPGELPWSSSPQGFPRGPGEQVAPNQCRGRWKQPCHRHRACRSAHSPPHCQPTKKHHEGVRVRVGNRDKEAPDPRSVGTGSFPCPSTHRLASAGSVKMSFERRGGDTHTQRAPKATNPQPWGWPGGKPLCCRSLQHRNLAAFPPYLAAPHGESPPNHTTTGENSDTRGSIQPHRGALGAAL